MTWHWLARCARRRGCRCLSSGAPDRSPTSKLIAECGVVGAAAGSFFVFKGAYRAVLISYPTPAQKDELIRANLAH